MFKAAPTAPSPDGLKATDTETALGGAADFWLIWPRKHGKTKAIATWGKMTPDQCTAALAAAQIWAAHYAVHNIDKKWIPEPANWLANERWDEDLPIIHADAKGAAITKAKANALPKPANDNEADDYPSVHAFTPRGLANIEIVDATVVDLKAGQRVKLKCEYLDGENAGDHFQMEFVHSTEDKDANEAGARLFGDLQQVLGPVLYDTDELLFKPLTIDIDSSGTVTFYPIEEQNEAAS
ncbi:MAG: hypothetical protein ACOH2N_11215 [Devosia sp.]